MMCLFLLFYALQLIDCISFTNAQSDCSLTVGQFLLALDQMFKVNKLFITWLFALFLQAHNQPMGII